MKYSSITAMPSSDLNVNHLYDYRLYTTGWQISKMWLAKASSIQAKFETLTCKNYASYVKCEISLPCSIKRTLPALQ